MSRYDQGRRLEWAARDALTAAGYLVLRSAGSKTPVDLAAFRPAPNVACPPDLVFVQCKTDGYLLPADRQRFARLADELGFEPLVADWYKEGRAARMVRFRKVYKDGLTETWRI